MKITRYGITLERLTPEKTELVRGWRNDKKINRFMFYKGEITSSMQQEWFESVDNEQNFFFLIYYRDAPVGLINISSIDWDRKTAYTGLFIYEDKFLDTDIPVGASLAMLDVFFMLYDIQSVYAKVRGNNQVAHRYNTSLGFNRTKKIEFGLGYEYFLPKEIYLLEAGRLRNAAIRLKSNRTHISFDPANQIDVCMHRKLLEAPQSVLHLLEVEIT